MPQTGTFRSPAMQGGQAALLPEISASVPRYTSYPTAPHFHQGVTGETFRDWLLSLERDEEVSLYVHIPFCDRLCWFCACHTKQTRRYEPVAEYLRSLHREIDTIGRLIGDSVRVRAVHFGGGSPTMLKPEDLVALDGAMRDRFAYDTDAEISVEIDPNDMDDERFDALAAIGLTRASLGVQDFDPRVQKAINRDQSFEQTRWVVAEVRARGARSVNLDLLYGLPHQTVDSVAATATQALTLMPDRIALFGYAHVPWFKKHQTMIDENWLPDAAERLAQAMRAGEIIVAAGYRAIGLDHFALPTDGLAEAARVGRLHRSFQGYTDDACQALIAMGPSSISQLRQGYAQNTPATGHYAQLVADGGLATARGIALTDDDRARRWVIEQLMCNFAFCCQELESRFGAVGAKIADEARRLAAEDENGHLLALGDMIEVAHVARPIVRTIAARFDAYLSLGQARHSVAV